MSFDHFNAELLTHHLRTPVKVELISISDLGIAARPCKHTVAFVLDMSSVDKRLKKTLHVIQRSNSIELNVW